MSVSTPKIDSRTYDDLVAQTAELAEGYTLAAVEPTVAALTGRTLAKPPELKEESSPQTLPTGTFLDQQLAQQVCNQLNNAEPVKVRGWQASSTKIILHLRPRQPAATDSYLIDLLADRTLAEDLTIQLPNNQNKTIPQGTVIDRIIARDIVKAKPEINSVTVNPLADVGEALIRIFPSNARSRARKRGKPRSWLR